MIAPLYDSVDGWPGPRRVPRAGLEGVGDGFLALADLYTDRGRDGRFTSNSNDVIYAVNCIDRPAQAGADQARAATPALQQASPRFGAYLAWSSLPCATWPVQPVDAPHVITADGAPPILVVGTTRDPATPDSWSERLASQLLSGVLLTYDWRRAQAPIAEAASASTPTSTASSSTARHRPKAPAARERSGRRRLSTRRVPVLRPCRSP